MFYVKVTSERRLFLVDLRDDGSLLECDLFDRGEKWQGTWSKSLFAVSPRKAGPGAFSGRADGMLIEIGSYTAKLLPFSPTYWAGSEFLDGRPHGTQMLFEMGNSNEALLFDIERITAVY